VSVLWPSALTTSIALLGGAAAVVWLLYRFSTPRHAGKP
jgi:hypothetical protein